MVQQEQIQQCKSSVNETTTHTPPSPKSISKSFHGREYLEPNEDSLTEDDLKSISADVTQNCPSVIDSVPGSAPGYDYIQAPDGWHWEFRNDMSDEFEDGVLDREKWSPESTDADGRVIWWGRQPGFFKNTNVQEDPEQEELTLQSRMEDPTGEYASLADQNRPYGQFSTAFVKTIHTACYGYFEIVCKMMDSNISSAFWFKNQGFENNQFGRLKTEIDVFEYSTSDKPIDDDHPYPEWDHAKLLETNFHVMVPSTKPGAYWQYISPEFCDGNGFPSPISYNVQTNLSHSYKKIALFWTPDKIQIYLNDVMLREVQNQFFHDPLYLQLDSETFPYWFGLPQTTAEMDKVESNKFHIKYVRSWSLVPNSDDQSTSSL